MAKLMIKAVGVFALMIAYATGAWAANCGTDTDPADTAHLEVCVVGGPSYAADLFGDGSDDVVLSYADVEAVSGDTSTTPPTVCVPPGTNAPQVLIELGDTSADSGTGSQTFAANSKLEIAYMLTGATFGERVSNGDVMAAHNGANTSVAARVIEGGAPGDSQVIFEVEATQAITYSADWTPPEGTNCVATDFARGDADEKAVLVFTVPALTEASAALGGPALGPTGVRVSVTVDGIGATGLSDYPQRDQAFDADANSDGKKDADSGSRLLLTKSGKSAVTLTRTMGTDGVISPDARETLLGATGKPLNPQQLMVGGVAVGVDSSLAQSDGEGFSVEDATGRRNDGDGAGELLISSMGDFRSDDMLYLDMNGNAKYDAGAEVDMMLTMDGGMASGAVSLDGITSGTLYYVPNGKDALRSGSISTSYSASYTQATNLAPRATASLSELNYSGAATALLAYAIAPPSSPDESNIRIRCDSSSDCQVYLACDGADGMDYFGKMDAKIGARMVETVTAMELAEVVGAEDADFAGRMSCEVIGSSINVQVLTRSGGTLVNNTYVGGPLDEQVRKAITQAMSATAEAEAATEAGDAAQLAACQALGQTFAGDATDAEKAAARKDAGCPAPAA
jgi:hypothetical protein